MKACRFSSKRRYSLVLALMVNRTGLLMTSVCINSGTISEPCQRKKWRNLNNRTVSHQHLFYPSVCGGFLLQNSIVRQYGKPGAYIGVIQQLPEICLHIFHADGSNPFHEEAVCFAVAMHDYV